MPRRNPVALADASARPARRPVTFHAGQAKYTLPQAEAYTGQSRTAFYRMFKRGLLTPEKLMGRTVIDGDQLRALLANLPTAPVRQQAA